MTSEADLQLFKSEDIMLISSRKTAVISSIFHSASTSQSQLENSGKTNNPLFFQIHPECANTGRKTWKEIQDKWPQVEHGNMQANHRETH